LNGYGSFRFSSSMSFMVNSADGSPLARKHVVVALRFVV
jgi:hypothetical protein